MRIHVVSCIRSEIAGTPRTLLSGLRVFLCRIVNCFILERYRFFLASARHFSSSVCNFYARWVQSPLFLNDIRIFHVFRRISFLASFWERITISVCLLWQSLTSTLDLRPNFGLSHLVAHVYFKSRACACNLPLFSLLYCIKHNG